MHALLLVLHALFFAPIVQRLTRGKAPETPVAEVNAIASTSVLARHPRAILLLHGAALVLLYMGLILAFGERKIARTITPHGGIGALVILGANALMAWSLMALQSWRLSPKVEVGDQLCTTGPYGVVRHPIYLAVDLLGLGSAIWVPTPLVIWGALLLVIGGDFRSRTEEKVLLQAFGDRYRDYMRRVRRTLPGIY
jgi:protein-S-isoprenylcysteine O-methyltransferase Ste14